MSMNNLAAHVCGYLLAAASIAPAAAQSPLAGSAEALAIHDRALTIDTHVDVPLDYASAAMDPGGFTTAQVDLPKMRAGGLDAAFFIVYTPQGPLSAEGYTAAGEIARTRLAAIRRMIAAYPDDVELALNAKDAWRIARTGRRVAFIGMENAFPLGPGANDLSEWAGAGVRYVGITHFGHNQFGDSSNPNPAFGDAEVRWGGLSEAGRDLVAALNRAGIMVDVSHAGKATMMQAADLSSTPIIASHSGVKAIADSPRNLDDEQLRKIAEVGGVAQIVALDAYVKPFTAEQIAFRDELRKELGLDTPEGRDAATPETQKIYEQRIAGMWEIAPRANVADLVDHIDHAVKIAGVEHVGIASDFDGGGGIDGWTEASETANVTLELVARGYSETDIAKIWGGNLLRVLAEVEKAAD